MFLDFGPEVLFDREVFGAGFLDDVSGGDGGGEGGGEGYSGEAGNLLGVWKESW